MPRRADYPAAPRGKQVETLQSAFLIRDADGSPSRIAVVISDITVQKGAEEALRQSYEELRTIYESMIDGLLVADLDTAELVLANPTICQMLGYSEDELLALPATAIHLPEDVPSVLQRFKERVAGQRQSALNLPARAKDGSTVPVDIVSNTMTFRGRPCIVGFFRDVTERRRTEEELARQHRTLKHLLHSSDDERQVIAYEIHDGLAQQLAAAIMHLQTYEVRRDARPEYAAAAYDAGMKLLRQGHDETRRLIAGLRPPVLDESGVVEAIEHLVHEQGRQKGPKINYHSMVDFDRLAPALENAVYRICQEALTNAVEHSRTEKVRVSLVQLRDRMRIEVRDWGIGFDAKTAGKGRFGLEGIRQHKTAGRQVQHPQPPRQRDASDRRIAGRGEAGGVGWAKPAIPPAIRGKWWTRGARPTLQSAGASIKSVILRPPAFDLRPVET